MDMNIAIPGLKITFPYEALDPGVARVQCEECGKWQRVDKADKGLLVGEIAHSKSCASRPQIPAVCAAREAKEAKKASSVALVNFAQLERTAVIRFLETIQQLEALIGAEPAAGDRASNAHVQQLLSALRELFVAPPSPVALTSSAAQPVEGWTYDEEADVHFLRAGIFRFNVFAACDRPDTFYWSIGVGDNTIVAMNMRTVTIGLVETKLVAERALLGKLRDAASILGFKLTKATP